jgi:uncharacterized protein
MSGTPNDGDEDPRFLEGIALFNAREFFDAHEVWEDLWHDTPRDGDHTDRRFIQAMIQAAVALHHAGNGNRKGAVRLYHSARRYMTAYGDSHRGIDIAGFWVAMTACLAEFLAEPLKDTVAEVPQISAALLPILRRQT